LKFGKPLKGSGIKALDNQVNAQTKEKKEKVNVFTYIMKNRVRED
jgi:hypothetical protein